MRRPPPELEADTLALSFLDVISCGLGAGIFLGLIFSVTRSSPSVDATAERFLDITFTVDSNDPVLNVFLKPPGKAGYFLPLVELDGHTGKFSAASCAAHPELNKITFLGFSTFGELRIESGTSQVFNFLIEDPAIGDWTVDVLYRHRRDWDEKLTAESAPVDVKRNWIVRYERPREEQVHASLDVGSRTRFEPIPVTQ